jgi:hypothetical protein
MISKDRNVDKPFLKYPEPDLHFKHRHNHKIISQQIYLGSKSFTIFFGLLRKLGPEVGIKQTDLKVP